jgi:hypothetical protein
MNTEGIPKKTLNMNVKRNTQKLPLQIQDGKNEFGKDVTQKEEHGMKVRRRSSGNTEIKGEVWLSDHSHKVKNSQAEEQEKTVLPQYITTAYSRIQVPA